MLAKRPSVEAIQDLIVRLKEIYRPLHSAFEEEDRFYEGNFLADLKLPSEFAEMGSILPTGRDMIDGAVDHTDVANARVYVNRKGISASSKEAMEMMRKLYLGIIFRTSLEADISPWRVGSKHFWLHGAAVFQTVTALERWPDSPIRQEEEGEEEFGARVDEWRAQTHQSLPIFIRAIHPHNVMADPSYGEKKYVVERYEKMLYDVSLRWPRWSNPKRKTDELVDYSSYCDALWRYEEADGEPLLPGEGVLAHNYGFLPYVVIESGLGNLSYDGSLLKRYVGLLRYMKDLLIGESRAHSMRDIILKLGAWPWGYLEGPNAAAVEKLEQRFGTYTPLPEGVKPVQMTPQVPPEALRDHQMIIADYIAAHSIPRSLRGLPETGVRSRVDRQLMVAEGGAKLAYATQAFENGTAKVLINCARLLKNNVPGDVRVWARTPIDEFDVELKKDLMKEPFTCYVEFAPISEEDEYRRHDDLERLVSAKIVTLPWARRQMPNVDPEALEREEERERLRQDPVLQGLVSQYAQGKLARAISKASAAEGIPQATPPQGEIPSGVPGGQPELMRPMVPPVPQGAMPGSAQAMQLALAKLRSQSPISPTQGLGGGGS